MGGALDIRGTKMEPTISMESELIIGPQLEIRAQKLYFVSQIYYTKRG